MQNKQLCLYEVKNYRIISVHLLTLSFEVEFSALRNLNSELALFCSSIVTPQAGCWSGLDFSGGGYKKISNLCPIKLELCNSSWEASHYD